jgi:hypothetical protein
MIRHPSSGAFAQAAKTGLLEAIGTALGDQEIDRGLGFRWPPQYDDAVAVTTIELETEDPGAMTNRTRDVTAHIGVVVTAFVPGFDEAAKGQASDRAYEVLGTIDAFLRDGDNITLGGNVMWVLCGAVQDAGYEIPDSDEDVGHGYVTTLIVDFVARAKVGS